MSPIRGSALFECVEIELETLKKETTEFGEPCLSVELSRRLCIESIHRFVFGQETNRSNASI